MGAAVSVLEGVPVPLAVREPVCDAVDDVVGATVDEGVLTLEGVMALLAEREPVGEAVPEAVGAAVEEAVLALEGVTALLAVREPVVVELGVPVLVPVNCRVRAPLAIGHRNSAVPLTYSSAPTVRVRVSPLAPVSVSVAPTRSAQQSIRENATTSTIAAGERNTIVADCTPGPSLIHTPSTAPGVEMTPRSRPSLMLGALNRNASVDQL